MLVPWSAGCLPTLLLGQAPSTHGRDSGRFLICNTLSPLWCPWNALGLSAGIASLMKSSSGLFNLFCMHGRHQPCVSLGVLLELGLGLLHLGLLHLVRELAAALGCLVDEE